MERTGPCRSWLKVTNPAFQRGSTLAMQFRIQFLDGAAIVVRELSANARSAASAFGLVAADDCPLEAVSIRREVRSAIRGDARS